jgi:TonB family protein
MILRVTLIISLLLHVMMSLVFQKFHPFSWTGERLKTYRVDLIRSAVEDLDNHNLSESDIERIKQDRRALQAEDQDTISLDTRDKRYAPYTRVIKAKIMGEWTYPAEARENLIEGRLLAVFTLARDGHMMGISIAESSGYPILDSEVVRAIRSAAPFPPFPGHIKVSRLNIRASFDYRVTSRK